MTSNVVKFGCIVNVYRIGRTLFGNIGLCHGNGSPFVAIGLNGCELLKLSGTYPGGIFPAHPQSVKWTRKYLFDYKLNYVFIFIYNQINCIILHYRLLHI